MSKIYTEKDIREQLEKMGAPRDSVVLMHSSLRAVGDVEGGAEGLLDALVEYFTSDGGLFCVPTHTWAMLDDEITLDVTSDKTCLGAFSTVALHDGRGIRSLHPTHSMVVFGEREKAEKFFADEPFIKSATSPESCYGKLYKWGGCVLLVGVGHNRNTYIHSVEEMLNIPNRMEEKPNRTVTKMPSGELIERDILEFKTDYIDDVSLRFVKYETPFRYHRCIVDGFIGNAPTQLCDARKMKKTIELIYKNSDGVDVLSDEKPIPQKYYAHK
ncbi:MAG: AAC(3) family N-acetyltransferase [Clostridia bacterium]|nr:AAC(3) family N-acetyltransferase [Clostridia bacterium]